MLVKSIDGFRGKTIGVLGDVMLDHFIFGDTDRISPEAPVPVVRVVKESTVPGGAGNVAANIAALGGKVFLVGVVGKDSAGEELKKVLVQHGIDTKGIIVSSQRPTTQKMRIIVQGQQVVRVDRETKECVDSTSEKSLLAYIKKHIIAWDALVISDYVKGVLTESLMQKVLQLGQKHHKPIIGDIKPKHIPFCKGITVLAPNCKEVLEAARINDVVEAGKIIQRQCNCAVVVTEGADGMLLFEGDMVSHFPAHAHEVFDVAGAGDTVTAVIALSLSLGMTLSDAVFLANRAGGIVVGKTGVATVSPGELQDSVKDNESR